MARVTISLVLFSIFLLLAVALAAPAENVKEVEQQKRSAVEKEDLVSGTDDLKPAASHWGGYGGWGHYGGYPYYGGYWGGWPSYGYGHGYGYWPYGGVGHYGSYWW